MHKATFLLIMVISVLVAGHAQAQTDYPSRQIEFIIPFPPGGPADTAARIIQLQLSANLGVPIVLVTKAGGGGALGGDYVLKAKPDGYAVYASTNSTLTIITATQPDIPYRLTDFTPIGGYLWDVGSITSKATSPWKTIEELVDYGKKNPGKLSYGSAGVGTVSHLSMEIVKSAYGLDIAHVPFQGSGPVKNAILGGHVSLATSSFSSMAPLIKSGDLIGLVTTSPKRLAAFPNIPTMAEKGFPDATLNLWMGLFVSAKTPRAVVDKLTKALEKTMKDPAVVAAVEKAGMIIDYRDPEASRMILEKEYEAVKRVAPRLGIGK